MDVDSLGPYSVSLGHLAEGGYTDGFGLVCTVCCALFSVGGGTVPSWVSSNLPLPTAPFAFTVLSSKVDPTRLGAFPGSQSRARFLRSAKVQRTLVGGTVTCELGQ